MSRIALLSVQVYRQADAGWKLEKSASLAVLRSHRAAIEALLADVKYDKIAHVRQVSALAGLVHPLKLA